MSEGERDRAFEAFVAGRSPALLRTAYLVTGDGSAAERLLVEALAQTYLAWNRIDDREGVEVYVRRVMLTAHTSSSGIAGSPPSQGPAPRDVQGRIWQGLRELTPRERAVLVLASREQLDDEEIARVLTCSRRSVQADGQHAAILVREALARPLEPQPQDHTDPEPFPQDEPVEPVPTMAGLEVAIRATLAAHADDVRPPLALADEARDRAEQLRRGRRKRRLAGAGVALAVVGCAVGIAALTASPSGEPGAAPTVSPSPGPGSSPSFSDIPIIDEPVPLAVHEMAAATGALVAVGHTIVDGANDVQMPTTVEIDPDNGEAVVQTIHALARVDGGYVVLTGPYRRGSLTGDQVIYVDRRGNVTPLGMSAFTYGLTVSPDGLLVAFAEARAAGKLGVVAVRELSGQVTARREMDVLSAPVWLDRQGVWVSPQIDPGGSPSYWNLATNALDPMNVPSTEIVMAAHGQQLVLDDFVGDGCTHAWVVPTPATPQELWSDCAVTSASYSPTGELVALVTMAPDTDVTVVSVRDARTGQVVAQKALLDRPVIYDLRWTSGGQYLVATSSTSADGERGILTLRVGTTSGRLPATRYPLTDDTEVVLGQELPLPPGSR